MTGRGKVKSQRISIAKRAGTIFPVSRIRRYLKGCTHHQRVAIGAPIYQAAVMEYLSAEILELAGNAANDNKKRRITPRHILLAIANDEELNKLLKNVTIPSGGVMPHILPELVMKKGNSTSHITYKSPPKVSSSPIKKAKNKVMTPTKGMKRPVVTKPVSSPKPVTTPVKPASKSPIKSPFKQNNAGQIQTLSEKILFLGQKLTVIQGDITNLVCDAVVHPTNGSFYAGGQVGAALIRVGGEELQKSFDELATSHGNLAYAGALLGDGPGLKSKHVIHVHSPQWGKDSSIKDLEIAVKNALTLVDEKNLTSIAFPSIGSGTNNFPKQVAAQTIFKSISNYFVTVMASSIKNIYFVLYDMESIAVYTTELARLE